MFDPDGAPSMYACLAYRILSYQMLSELGESYETIRRRSMQSKQSKKSRQAHHARSGTRGGEGDGGSLGGNAAPTGIDHRSERGEHECDKLKSFYELMLNYAEEKYGIKDIALSVVHSVLQVSAEQVPPHKCLSTNDAP